ncbi:DNA recombination protein RmuC [Acidobacteriia bacterium AH_259_A11_L15]|nr:DNA recombination protein RmuC [Acidobacteriia bacterium AH_259_A11_L15]
MEIAAVLVAVVVAVLVGIALSRFGARMEQQGMALRDDMQAFRQEANYTIQTQMGQVVQSFNQQLDSVRTTLQQGLADSGSLAQRAQQDVGQRLAEATRAVTEITDRLGSVQEAGRELRQTAQTLETLLSGARTRGSLGEVALERLLADAIPQDSYELQHRFRSGVAVDAVVKLGEKLLPLDSKFPLDAYRRLREAETPEQQEQARKEFARAVRGHVDDIAGKYILPAEGTLDLAFMFLASEGVYYELLFAEDSKGSVAEYCRRQRVFPVSPNSLYAYLAVILMGLRGMQVEENAVRLLSGLSGLKRELEAFLDVHNKLGNHLKNASQSYAEAGSKLERLERSLTTLTQGLSPAGVAADLTEAKKE